MHAHLEEPSQQISSMELIGGVDRIRLIGNAVSFPPSPLFYKQCILEKL